MTLNKVVLVAIIATFLILFPPESFPFTSAIANDIQCLQSMKESLQDPFGYLTSTWNFDNITEGSICDFVGVDCWHANENKVLNIRLSDMGLKGLFPVGLEMCTSLTGLDISSNYLSGPIPLDIGQNLRFITSLDLSNNNFSGLIPPSLATCNYLGSLKLDNNNLSGSIPSDFGLMSRIYTFSVSNNRLTGPVPNFIKASPILFYANNPGLCGQYPLKKCKDIGSASGNSNRALFFSGFLTGWAVTASLVIFICLFGKRGIALEKLITKKKNMKKKPKVDEKNLRPKAREIDNTHKMAKLERYITRIPFAELTKATANFSQDNVIGIGKMGTMYKARIPNGWFLAIKKLFNSEQLDRQLASEIITLGRLKHCRLVHLIGFCLEKQDIFLVYKYMSNGNLYNWLHNRISSEGDTTGYWPLRVKVAVGVAEGLAWLHHKCSFMVVHGAISSKSILLDKNFEPKISSFWEAKFIKSNDFSSSNWSFFLTVDNSLEFAACKKDVYCFGVLLLELITRKKSQELASFIKNLSDTSLPYNFSSLFMVDETLIGQGFDDEIVQCFQVAKNCVLSNPDRRPSMLQVHETLAAFAQIYNYTNDLETSY